MGGGEDCDGDRGREWDDACVGGTDLLDCSSICVM